MSGQEVDYYGRLASYSMSLAELDEVILSQNFAALDDFPIGSPTSALPALDEDEATLPVSSRRRFDRSWPN